MDAEGSEEKARRQPDDSQAEEEAQAPPARDRKRRGAWGTAMGWLALVMNVSAGGLLVWRAHRFAPENYWAFETRLFWLPAGATFVWGMMELFWWRRRGRLLPILVLLSALALGAVVFVFDYYNVLIPLQRWVERGFPRAWTN